MSIPSQCYWEHVKCCDPQLADPKLCHVWQFPVNLIGGSLKLIGVTIECRVSGRSAAGVLLLGHSTGRGRLRGCQWEAPPAALATARDARARHACANWLKALEGLVLETKPARVRHASADWLKL